MKQHETQRKTKLERIWRAVKKNLALAPHLNILRFPVKTKQKITFLIIGRKSESRPTFQDSKISQDDNQR